MFSASCRDRFLICLLLFIERELWTISSLSCRSCEMRVLLIL
uniref:Putative histidine-containing phosphotransfer protein 3b n=1 Tax=Rhizophora mucronata TaxID=61149 RepID=A0A2P2ISG6_RHIMU